MNKKKKEEIQVAKIRDEKGATTIEIKRIKKEYYKKLLI